MKHVILVKKMVQLILITLVISGIPACGPSTEIVKTWQEPNVTLSQSTAGKTLVMAMVKDETSRRVIEDQLVKRIGSNAVASYVAFPSEMLKTVGDENSEIVFAPVIKRLLTVDSRHTCNRLPKRGPMLNRCRFWAAQNEQRMQEFASRVSADEIGS